MNDSRHAYAVIELGRSGNFINRILLHSTHKSRVAAETTARAYRAASRIIRIIRAGRVWWIPRVGEWTAFPYEGVKVFGEDPGHEGREEQIAIWHAADRAQMPLKYLPSHARRRRALSA